MTMQPTSQPTEEGWYYAQKKASLGYTGCPLQPTHVVEGIPFKVLEWGGTTEWSLDDYDWYGPVPMPTLEAISRRQIIEGLDRIQKAGMEITPVNTEVVNGCVDLREAIISDNSHKLDD